MPRRSTAACDMPGVVRVATLAVTVPAILLAFAVGSDFMPQLDEGAFLLQTVMPPDTSLEEVDRVNHRVEDVLRGFDDVEDVVRRTGRAERTEDPMPHVMSDVLVVLKPDRRAGLRGSRAGDARGAAVGARGHGALHDAARHAHRRRARRHARGPVGAHLRPRSRRAGAPRRRGASASWPRSTASRTCASTRSAGLPQLRIAIDREAVARVGLTPGDVIRALRDRPGRRGGRRRSGSGSAATTWSSGFGRSGAEQRRPRFAICASRRTTARASRSSRWRASKKCSRPAPIRREAGSRRIAVEASVAGRDLGGAAAEVRTRLAADLTPAHRLLRRRRRPGRAAGARGAVADAGDRRRRARPCSCCSIWRSARSPRRW